MMGYIAQFNTTIRDALWDTLSGLYSEYLEFGHHYKMVQPLVHCVVSKERFWTQPLSQTMNYLVSQSV